MAKRQAAPLLVAGTAGRAELVRRVGGDLDLDDHAVPPGLQHDRDVGDRDASGGLPRRSHRDLDRGGRATRADLGRRGLADDAGGIRSNLSTSAANGIYNFGVTAASTERAIGFLASGTATASGNLYAELVNNTGAPLSGLSISYNVEKYRNGSNANGFRIQLFWSDDGSTWTSAGTPFMTAFPADANNNGFAVAPGATVPVSDLLNVTIQPGANFYLAWNYSVTAGNTVTNAQALAVDDISILGLEASNPSGQGSADPPSVVVGAQTTLSATAFGGSSPPSTGLVVSCDLTAIGGSATFNLPNTSGNTYSAPYTVPLGTPGQHYLLPCAVSDDQGRSGSFTIALDVTVPFLCETGAKTSTRDSRDPGLGTLEPARQSDRRGRRHRRRQLPGLEPAERLLPAGARRHVGRRRANVRGRVRLRSGRAGVRHYRRSRPREGHGQRVLLVRLVPGRDAVVDDHGDPERPESRRLQHGQRVHADGRDAAHRGSERPRAVRGHGGQHRAAADRDRQLQPGDVRSARSRAVGRLHADELAGSVDVGGADEPERAQRDCARRREHARERESLPDDLSGRRPERDEHAAGRREGELRPEHRHDRAARRRARRPLR